MERNNGAQYRLNIATGLGLLLGMQMVASTALAQAPANDEIANATVVTAIPFAIGPIDTSQATAGADDPQDCHNNGSNWYTFTPTTDTAIEINTLGSDYDTTLGVYAGSPDSLSLVGCNDDFYGLLSSVRFEATANTTYFFMVGVCCGNEGSGGGTLFFNVRETPPALDITLLVDSQVSFEPHTGAATIGGTLTCNTEAAFTEVFGTLRQRVGRHFITGTFHVWPGQCSPPSLGWSTTVMGDGLFRGGKVTLDVSANACDEVSCDSYSAGTTTRQMKRGKRQ